MADNFIDSATNSGATIKTPPTVSSTLAAGGTGTGFDDLVARAYDKMVDFQLRSQVVFRDLADKRPVQQAMPGYAVTFSLYNDLAKATTPLAEVTDLDAAALDDVDQVSVVLKEYGNAVVNTRYVQETAFADVDPAIGNIIAFNMIDSLDSVVSAVLDGAAAGQTEDRNADVIQGTNIRKAVAKLRGDNVVPRQGSLYAAYMHPDVAFDLRNETGALSFEDIRKHTEPNVGAILDQTTGVFGGTYVIETSRAPMASATGPGGEDEYSTFIVGQQALAEACAVEPSVKLGPVVDRLSRFRPIGWYSVCGWALYRTEALRKITSGSTIATNAT